MSSADELAKIKAARAELAARREARLETQDADDELVEARLTLAGETALEDAEQKHGALGKKIAVVKTRLGWIILKSPHPNLFKRFAEKQEYKIADLEAYVFGGGAGASSIVYPDRTEVEAIFKELPAALQRCAAALNMLAGVTVDEASGK